MKASEHKVTMLDVLTLLAVGPKTAQEIGEECWPDKVGFGSPNGGPSSVAVSASYMLGKLSKRVLVHQSNYRSNYRRWHLTNKGERYLREKTQMEVNAKAYKSADLNEQCGKLTITAKNPEDAELLAILAHRIFDPEKSVSDAIKELTNPAACG